MAVTKLLPNATEESTYAITVSWYDESDNAVTPSAATWTLTDLNGNVINSRLAVAIGSLSTSNTIVLKGDDLAIGANGIDRQLLLEYTYTSDLGAGLPGKWAAQFVIAQLAYVT
jgi:hypothetical protein